MNRAQDVANLLQKYGGWKLGLPQFSGTIEYASSDERILQHIPEDVKRVQGSTLWVDGSEPADGKREIETASAEDARLIFEFPKVVRELKEGERSSDRRLYVLEVKTDRLIEIVEKLAKVLEVNATVEASLAEHTVLSTAEKAVDSKVSGSANGEASEAKVPDPYDGVMYG